MEMEEVERGPILGHVAGVPVANSSYSGELSGMTLEQLQSRFRVLLATDPDDEDADEAFMARGEEMDAIRDEIERRQKR